MNSNTIKILALGDIVGTAAADALCSRLWKIRDSENIDFVVANGENVCGGKGIDPAYAKKLLSSGVDVITSGNHIWQKRDIFTWLDDGHPIIRPANYPPTNPGNGYYLADVNGYRALIINVLGVVYMDALDNPFRSVSKILDYFSGKYDFAVLDIHAEATSEKLALANCFDGKISVIFGTHTHVPTADERIFPNGTGYITDLGMCGPVNSVLGVKPEIIIAKMTTNMPQRFETAEGSITATGAIFDISSTDFRTVAVTRVKYEF